MKFHDIMIFLLFCSLYLLNCINTVDKGDFSGISLQNTNKETLGKRQRRLNSNEHQDYLNKFYDPIFSSFMELETKEKVATTMLAMNRLEHQLYLKMAHQLMENRKKRYTENGKECAPTFTHEGKTYDDCTMVKTPDMQDARREWCYIKEDQLEDNKQNWDFCRPDLNYDKLRSYNQDQMLKFNQQYKQNADKLTGTINDLMALENQANAIDKNFQELDMMVGGLLTGCRDNTNKMENLIQDNKETANLENFGASIGAVLSMKEATIGSSFLELSIKPSDFIDGPALVLSGPDPNYLKEGDTYGSIQSDSDEIVSKDAEDGHMIIAPWLQFRQLSKTKNGAGMDNYEQDQGGDGLIGKYFDNMSFLGSFYTQKDGQIDFDFTGASPAPGVNNENFSIRWAGSVLAPHSGEFQFILDTDGGMSLSVNDQLILSRNMLTPNQDPASRTKNFLLAKIREASSNSNNPKSVKSLKINLIGGNKYKIIVSYYHTSANMMKEEDPVYIKLFWQSNIFKRKIIEKKYLFSENVFDPMKVTGISPEIGVIRKLLENDLAFKDQNSYVLTDIPPDYVGYNCLKLNMKFFDAQLIFELNNPSTVYIAFPESYPDPTPIEFEETNQIINVNQVPMPARHQWKETKFKAATTIPFKVKKKPYDAGKIVVPLNKAGVNAKSITMLVFYGFDKFNDTPITCGGEEFWISQPTSPYYLDCKASTQDVNNSRRCEEGLNGEMRDEPHGGSIWASINEGVGAWMQINFKEMFQVSRVEFQDRSKQIERNKVIEVSFSNGSQKLLRKQNTSERREYKIDPPVKSHFVKFTIRQVFSTGNNGGAFKIYGYKCKKATPDDDSPANVGSPFITGIPVPELPSLFDLQKNKPVKLSCYDTLDTNKFNPHTISVGSKILILCKDSCVTSDDDLRIYGNKNKYSQDSIICKAALHSEILPIEGGKLYMKVGPMTMNLTGSISSGIRAWPKRFTKYTISFSKFKEEDEIILKEGSSVDLKNPNREGWMPGKIMKVIDTPNAITVQCVVENSGPDDPVFEIQYPARQRMAPCGEYIPGRDCEGSRKNLNKNRPLRWRFVTTDYQGTNDIRDFGGTFGSTGKAFGWSRDMTNRVKRRVQTTDPRMETLVEFPPSKKSLVCNSPGGGVNCEVASWSVKTGPGIYNVKIGIGDVFAASRIDLKINSNFIVKAVTLNKGEYQIYEGSTQAINDFITIRSECIDNCEFQMSKMNMVEISPVVDESGWIKMLANQRPPELYDECGKSTTGGRCFDKDPTNCLYDEPSSPGTHMCTGALNLVQVDPNYKCTEQRDKFKCVKRYWSNLSQCSQVCPRQCTKNSFNFLCQ